MTDTRAPDMVRAMMELEVPDAAEVRKMWDDINSELRVVRRDYALNTSFDNGDQYITWSTDLADAVIRDFRDRRDAESRTTVNLFRPLRRSLTASLTASELAFNVRAGSPDDVGLRRQRLCSEALEALRTRQQWERLRAEEVRYTMFGGSAAICWEWDPQCRNAPPALDPQTQTWVPVGGVRLSALSIDEFGLEPGSPTQEDATWWVRRTAAPPKQVQLTYGLATTPSPDASTRRGAMDRQLSASRVTTPKLTQVTALYRRPTSHMPGVVAHYVGEQCVAFSGWPFPHDDTLNLYVFSCDDPWERWFSNPWLNDARSPQTMYNDVRSVIREHAKRASNARIAVEEGSMDDPETFDDTPGQIILYNRGSAAPRWMEPPNDNRFLSNEVQRLRDELNEVFSRPDIARGVAPGDRNSGAALALLAEKADGPLGPFARDQARGWGVIATAVLRTMRHNMADGEQRQTVIYNQTQTPQPSTWTKEDIDINVEVVVPVESTEPRSFAAVRAQFVELARTFPAMFESIDAGTFARTLGLTNVQTVLREIDGSSLPIWENERLMSGTVCTPDEWNDHNLHIRLHEQLRNTPTYELTPPDRQGLLDDHIAAHKALAAEAAANAAMAQMRQQQMMMQTQPDPQAVAPEGAQGGTPQ